MSPERQTLLYQRYPVLYRGRKRPITESLMSFGFECGDGWFDLLERLSARIEARALERRARGTPETDLPEAEQVKEKYGTLRFYLARSDDDIDRWILEAEDESARTCELCGNPGELRGVSWYQTLCDAHARTAYPGLYADQA